MRLPNGVSTHTRQSPSSSRQRSITTVDIARADDDSHHQDGARLAEYNGTQLAAALAGPGTTWLKQFGLFTGTKAVANSAAAQAIPQWSKVWEPLYAKGKYLENLDHGDQIDSIISSALDSILLSDSNVKSALATANAQIVPLLNQ